MSQPRVTDFFSQRKRGIPGGPVKAAKQRGGSSGTTRSRSSKNKELCSSSIHEEFVRVIDEAVGLSDGGFAVSTEKHFTSSPRTPKRTSAEFDVGAAVFSATADHSTAKKKRQEADRDTKATVPEKVVKRKARKKLVLPLDSPQVMLTH